MKSAIKSTIYAAALILCMAFASAAAIEVKSDTQTEYLVDEATWSQAVPVSYIHPEWSNKINMPATWIWTSSQITDDEASQGGTAIFRRVFEIPVCAENIQGNLKITADNIYAVSLNTDPLADDGEWTNAENYDISSLLQQGENEFQFLTANEPMEGANYMTNPAGLIYFASISYDGCEPIPEFSYLGALAGLIGAATLFVVLRKK